MTLALEPEDFEVKLTGKGRKKLVDWCSSQFLGSRVEGFTREELEANAFAVIREQIEPVIRERIVRQFIHAAINLVRDRLGQPR